MRKLFTFAAISFLSLPIWAGGNIKEDFESYQTDKEIGGQGSWKEGLHGGHPSCKVIQEKKYGKSSKVLMPPSGRDHHVYRLLPAVELKSIMADKVVQMSFNFKGSVHCSLGVVKHSGSDGIRINCNRGISVMAGGKSFSGIASLDAKLWHQVIVILTKENNKVSLTIATLSDNNKDKKYQIIMGLDKIILPIKPEDLAKWNGLYIRLDGSGMFDDFELTSYDNIKDLPIKLMPPKLELKFKPITDHIMSPRQAIDLTGLWEAALVPEGKPDIAKNWQPVLVPDSHRDLFKGKSYVWFRRNIDLKDKDPNSRYFLCFERVTDGCEVLVNGKLVGSSNDGHFPFRIDATPALHTGSNEILIKVAGTKVTGGAKVRPSGWSWFLAGYRGIPYPVHLEQVGKIGIDDVFVLPTLKPIPTLETRVILTNRSDREECITLEASVGKDFSHLPLSFIMRPGESREVVLRDLWKNPKLWWPHDPQLQYLDLKVKSGDKVIDAYRQRFGFREFQVQGPDMMINGVRFLHRRDSMIPYWPRTSPEILTPYITRLRKRGFNGFRLHGGAPLRIIRTCDELGWLVSPESGINEPRGHQVAPEFWKHAEKHLRKMALSMRNSPSVIYWCLSNEFASYYMKGTPEEKAVVDAKMLAFGKMVEQIDPTRTWTCSGDGSLGGWGKPGPAPTLSFHYPSEPFKQRFTIPNSVYWLENKSFTSWQGIKWKKNKPLIFSEDLYMPYGIRPPGGMARWAGDKAYDIDKGFYKGWFDCIRMFAEGYYYSKLSGWNPWGTSANQKNHPLFSQGQPMPDYLLATREQNSTFFSEEKVKRTLYVYNQMFKNQNCKLDSQLYIGSKLLDQAAKDFKLNGGEMMQFDFSLPMPAVTKKTPLEWRLNLSADGKKLTSRTYKYTVYPKNKHVIAPANCALLSGNGENIAKHQFSQREIFIP